MIRLMGCVLVITGALGLAQSICRDGKRRLEMLKTLRGIFETMKYYIAYQKITIPESLFRLADRGEGLLSGAFREIYRRVYEKGEDFPCAWRKQMEQALADSPLTGEERSLILHFPACLGFMEENAQAGALDELLREINLHIEELTRDQKDKNRVVLSLGAAAGVLLSILLL